MIRRLLLTAALVAAAGRSAHAAACAPAADIINGFEAAGSACAAPEKGDITAWTANGVALAADTAPYTVLEGTDYGFATQNLKAITYTMPLAVNTDWDTFNYLYIAYLCDSATAPDYDFELLCTMNGTAAPFIMAGTPGGGGGLVEYSGGAPYSAANWTYVITSLNYARNMGLSTADTTQIEIEHTTGIAHPLDMAYDDLQLDPIAGTLDTPNVAIPPAQITAVPSCGTVTLSWSAPAQTGTDAIAGYHVYRSLNGAAGPFLSMDYVSSGTTYTDSNPTSTTIDYVVLPYSSVTTAFGSGPNTGYFTGLHTDPVWNGNFGVNEAAMVVADYVGPINGEGGCSPTLTPAGTSTDTPSATQSASPSVTFTLTDSPTSTDTLTASPTPSISPTFTPPPPGATNTWTPSNTPVPPTNTPGPTNTMAPTNTPLPSFTVTPTFTISDTFTPSPDVTPTPSPDNNPAYLYPNPFYVDQAPGLFHLGNVTAGQKWEIFDLVGHFVWKATTYGNYQQDTWNGRNQNGIEVTTGMYFLVLNHKVFRLAVVRGQ
jgi:hypothetical protein